MTATCGFCEVTLASAADLGFGRSAWSPCRSRAHAEEGFSAIWRVKIASSRGISSTVPAESAQVAQVFLSFSPHLPWGALIARVAFAFPGTTSRAYEWVASHRGLLGRLLRARPACLGLHELLLSVGGRIRRAPREHPRIRSCSDQRRSVLKNRSQAPMAVSEDRGR